MEAKNYKLLIFYNKDNIGHYGGPSGYLVPFLKHKNSFTKISLDFLDNTFFVVGTKKCYLLRLLKLILCFFFSKKVLGYLFDCAFFQKRISFSVDLNDYDGIIFHSSFDMYKCKNALKKYKGTVYLQSHSPMPFFRWVREDMDNYKEKFTGFLFSFFFKKIDTYSFKYSNYIIFPCRESEEGYFYKWYFFRKNKFSLDKKIVFLMTAIENDEIRDRPCFSIKEKLGIPKQSVTFLFAGSHIKSKGYNYLIKLAKLFKDNDRVFFINCGKVIKKRKNKQKNLVELGFTNNLYDIILETDFCFSLNEETYFDLSVLEYLSMGKTLILRRTGGNKKIAELFENNIIPFNTFDELFDIVKKAGDGAIIKRNYYDILNLYYKYFDIKLFLNEFESLMVNTLKK